MIKKQYSGPERRARNIIWNAAARYDFDPPFMAFFPNGEADHYFNMIAGLCEKHLDMEKVWDFFVSYEAAPKSDEFDDLLWLGLEHCIYEKELPLRPILEQLRKNRADYFFKLQQNLSRQQMTYQSVVVYSQQQYRWAKVLGTRGPILTPKEKRMAAALEFSGDLSTDELIETMKAFLLEFFRFTPGEKYLVNPSKLRLLLNRREHKRRDHLVVRLGTGEGNHARAVTQRHAGLGRYTGPTEEDAKYVESIFGASSISPSELGILENELCTGNDATCRLWVTNGKASGLKVNSDIQEIKDSIKRQKESNRNFLKEHAASVQNAVKSLSARIETITSSYFKSLPEQARTGQIMPEKAYRLGVLQDPKVFLKNSDEVEPEIYVDLLLDASQSRMHSQEALVSQAYVIAKGFEKAHIPVGVWCFRSLRGYTVLSELKTPQDPNCEGITSYYAGGWNRDGLAIKALERLEGAGMEGKKRIVLILTDANPNDSAPLAAGTMFAKEYDGVLAVKDAELAVRHLRNNGTYVGAVYHGSNAHIESAHQIYGHAYVRIQKISQLAQGVSDLLLMLLQEVKL